MILMKCIEDKFFYFQDFLPKEEYKKFTMKLLKKERNCYLKM